MPKDEKKMPSDVRWAIIAIAISWFFWGPIDGYYAIYLKNFNLDYSEIGWLLSMNKIISLAIAIPVGILADKFSARKMVLASLFGYLAMPLLYYYAGLTNSIIFAIIAILSIGILKVVRNVSMDTYIKEQTPPKLSGEVWAFHDGFIPFMWSVGVVAGSLLIMYFKIYELFLLVIIGILIKIGIFYRLSEAKKISKKKLHHIHKKSLLERMKRGFKHFMSLDSKILFLLLLTFLSGLFSGNLDSFLALYAENADYGMATIGFLVGFVNLAFVFAMPFTKITNKIGKFTSMAVGQMFMAFFMALVFFFGNQYFFVVLLGFFFHWLAFQLVRPARNGTIAAHTPYDMQGEMTGIQLLILAVANMLGAVLFGYISDYFGIQYIFLVVTIAYIAMAGMFWIMKGRYEHTVKHVKIEPHGSLLSRFHIDFLPHSLTHDAKYKYKNQK